MIRLATFFFVVLTCAISQGQLVKIREAKTVVTSQVVTTTTTLIDDEPISEVPEYGKTSEPKISKTKVVEASAGQGKYGPPTVEFETLDGKDASGAFVQDETFDRWTLTKPGKYRVIALAVERETFRIKREKYVIEKNPDVKPIDPDNPKLKVLVVYETEDLTKQRYVSDIIASPVIRQYLELKTREDGGPPQYRFFDQHTTFDRCEGIWCRAMKRPRKSLPWVIVSNPNGTYEGPLPKSVSEFLNLLKKYGG